jgi:hypothetical protein
MIQTGFETRVKVQQIIENQLPEFILDESPNAVDFLKQYYISQEYQGGPVDIAENLDQYLKLDNLSPEVVVGNVGLSTNITSTVGVITVTSTKGFPQKYGLFKINDEIITYTGITTNTFTGCIRGFSGITTYHTISNPQELGFSTSKAASHTKGSSVQNLSSLFLKEFYKKLKYSLTPGLEDVDFVSDLNLGNFIKEARSFYQAKGTDESFRILFNVLYGVKPKVVNLENLIIKPSAAEYIRREIVVAEAISGNPTKLVGQSIRKSSDTNTYASVSEVEAFTKNNKTYYQISLFIGYNESSDIQGTFNVQGKSLVIENVSVGSSVITVDSTIGFAKTGNLISGDNIISYTDKSINQFFGCSGIKNTISVTNSIRTDEVIYGYENGDLSKKVELRFTGVISKFVPLSEVFITEEGEELYVKNLGEIIKNPSIDKSYKEIFANSWIYNTSSRYQIDSISGSSLKLKSLIDKSSLKVGDSVEILLRDTEILKSSPTNIAYILNINTTTNQIDLANLTGFVYDLNLEYDIRRKLNKAKSSGSQLQFGNNILTSDIQNVYNENDEYMYVASNSLPSYTITKNLFEVSIPEATPPKIQGFDNLTQKYSIISFSSDVPFITGDEIYYSAEYTEIPGLTEGVYYVEVITQNQIRLYLSRSFINSNYDSLSTSRPYIQFDVLDSNSGSHYFTLNSQKNRSISPSKILKKFPLSPNLANGSKELTQPGSVGMLIDGVEIINYKSNDKIYYGPLDSVEVLNGGNGYDVINLPQISITSDIGSDAAIQPVIRGSLQKVFVDPQDFDINSIVSIALTGGNGSGASFDPVIVKRIRELSFDARESTNSGGLDINNETITFTTNHNLRSGDPISYDSNGNLPIGIGTYGGSNSNPAVTLSDGSFYYCSVVNSNTIQLYKNISDYNSGINTIGFTTESTAGIHKFRTEYNKSTLKEIKIINPGSGYENRKLIINPTGISTIYDSINFTNHGFKDGDLIVYNYENQSISGLSTSIQYRVLKITDDSFRLCNAGSAGTITSYYQRQDYIKLQSSGSGYQYFSYPQISLSVKYTAVGLGTTTQTVGIITATPIIRGEIVGAYLYERGVDYGSTILNLHKKPSIVVKNGKNSQISPIIVDGSVQNVFVQYGGSEYYSIPDLVVKGDGTGASLRPIILNGRIDSVIVVNPGVGYAQSTTSISIIPAGSNAIFNSNVRSLTVNANRKYGDQVISQSGDNLQYFVSGYESTVRSNFNDPDPTTKHSPIIGWAYDGNPIYGPYGYSDPQDSASIKVLKSGYELNTSNIVNRPSGFDAGFFVEDYTYTNCGDLDENNGRFGKTKDFPNGIYAYFATISSTNVGITSFPYFIGNSYRSNYINDNLIINQSFDFNSYNLIRNTLPYKVNDVYARNDFIIESNNLAQQKSIVESVTKSSIEEIDIINSGYNYKINDILEFDNTGTGGGGLNAIISSITGSEISAINTNVDTYQNSIFTWKDGNTIEVTITPNHSLSNADSVVISGLTSALSQINKLVKIGITSYSSTVSQNIPSNSSVGLVTDIYVSRIPDRISAGASMVIESEVLSVLNIFPYEKIIRAKRIVGSAHTATTTIQFIPNTFTLKADTDYFESKVNDKIFFNPSESVGLGRSVGVSTSRVFALGISTVGVATYVRNILTQSIYIENHPFANNQKVILRVPNSSYPLSISTSFSGTAFNMPGSGTYQTVYVTDKSKNTIGIKTTLSSSEVFFVGIGSDSYEYSIESNFDQVNAKVQKIKSTVSVSTAHNLSDGDTVTLTVNPNLSVGIGTSTSILVKYNSSKKKLLINPLQFTSSGINTSQNTITISNHSLNTGDKVFYSSSGLIASGLSTGSYFVYKIDDDSIKLASTYIDCKNDPPTVVSIASSGGNLQSISPINPEIKVIKNNNVVFNLSDSSLSGYKFKIFYDKDFNDEFISTGSTSSFSVTGVGTVGISTNASLTLNYSERLPQTLFYTLEKSGYISTSDKDVSNYSKISFVDSFYNGTYTVSGIGSTTFNIALKQNPEKSSYIPSECNILEYSTSSLTAKGGINKIKKLSTGSNYKKLPVFIGVASSEGSGSYVVAKSNSVGKIKEVRILNPGFEYGSDTTLRPTAYISPIITIESSYNISDVGVAYGGKNYNFAPNLTVINSITRKNINNGSLEAVLSNSSIVSVNIIEPPRGIPSDDVEIISTNNSNGTSVDKVYASGIGIVTCYLTTPILGFSTSPFSVGDKIYVEGIQNSNSGTGYNSENFGYTFFTVTGFQNTIPAKLEYNISGLTTSNPGVAKTVQNSLASIIKYTDYPQFNITKSFSNFKIGEKISSYDGANFVERDLIITNYNKSTIKVLGSYELSKNETIKGTKSGTFASISNIEYNAGRFDTNYSLRRNFGWNDDIGKLNEDYQVIEDNDYYQNLSYTIKSPIDYETLVSPVNRLLHTSGLKNFADTGITSTTNSGIKSSIDGSIQILNLADENRIDTINNFDLCIDTDSFENKTKYIKFKNKKLSDYIKCVSNRVLLIDDISSKFSNIGLESSDQNNLISILPNDEYNRYLIQITDTENTQYEISELIILNNQNNLYTLEKGFINNLGIGTYYESQRIAEVVGYVDENNNQFLRFNPVDIFNKDYNIKILNNKFINDLSGIGTQNLGLINLISSNVIVPTGITSSVVSVQSTTYNSLYFNLHVRDNSTYESNYVEIYLNHDGTNTYLSQYYVDSSSENNLSYGIIGSFGSTLSSGVLSLNFTNTSTNQVTIRSRTVGFGSTSSGISTYRYKFSEQIDGTELTAIYESKYSKNSGISTITSLSKDNFASVKSVVRVSVGNTSALHQVLLVNDGNNLAVKQYPFLSIGSTSGIGTFGGEYSGSNFSLKFYPDQTITGIVDISSYNEEMYKNSDAVNSPPNLSYGQIIESLNVYEYAGINGNRISRTSFDLNYQGYPIFKKTFNPKESSTLDLTTGIFTIKNHFYNTGEELSYAPKSSFIGIGETAVGIGSTANYVGVVTNLLPPKVYPIKLSDDTFRLSTRRDYALAGIYVTFTSYGLGNAHELEMSKKLEKSLITIDSLVQYPIAYTTLNYNLNKNGGQIGASSTIFSVSGISSIKPSDIVKIDDEYMLVVNVGFGTTNIGPITGVGTTALLQVTRGFVGSSSTTHTDSTSVKIYRGSYNISGNKIHFTNPPTGDLRAFKNSSNLTPPKSSFDGRVYLRKNYETNQLYDNISSKFTGIGRTYTLTVNGINTVGLGTSGGNGILFINSIFQRPSTSNNTGNNFSIIENAGISSVVFSGISTSSSSSVIVSNDDVNQNQLPRGGLIVSLGSTGGLGYAPLVGASVTAIVSGGSIVSVGLGTTDILGSGYYGSVSIGVTDSTGINASIRATVGAGGTLSFTILNGGSGYTNPTIKIPSPSYENLPVIGVSRLGIGSTTNTGVGLLVNIEVGSSSTTGIGSTLFEVRSFNIQRSGYGFKPGDVVTPVGLVTAKNLPSPISQFQLNVLDTFTDSFAAWQFGELDYIDSIKNLQDSVRVTFPLYYNASLLSFEIDKDDQDSSKIDLNNVLLIFINGVLQKPGDSYTFDGGSIFTFSNPPKSEDEVSIFFYRGSRDSDSILITNPNESIRSGDIVQLKKNNTIPSTINQNLRTVFTILGSDKIETNLYTNQGIDNVNYKPLSWTKQKIDQKINGQILYKSRDSIESEVYPTAKVIRDFSTTDIEIFVDDAYFFNYEENQSPTIIDSIDGLIVSGSPDSISAGATAVVSQSNTQLQYLSIGYSGSYYLTPTITNLHLRSEDFSTGWTLSNAANSSLTANVATSPDNLVTSGSFVCSTTGNATRRLYASTNITTVSGTDYTYSIYLKSLNNWQYVYISLSSGTTVTESGGVRFDIINGIVSTVSSGLPSIINAGNGWWRVSVTTSGNTITTMRPKIILVNSTGTASSSATGVINSGVYVWGSQLESKMTSSAYVPTGASSKSGSSLSINITPPNLIGVGLGTTATAIGSIVNGFLTKALLTYPGFGYTTSSPPRVLISQPSPTYEKISGITDVKGFSGIVTGIGTTTGTLGNPLAIKFNLNVQSPTSFPSGLTTGYPIYIYNTSVGRGVTSIDGNNTSTVGIGTTFLDNIYKIHSFNYTSLTNAYVICNVLSTTSVVGIATTGTSVGRFSWGRMSGFSRSRSPISIGVTGSIVDVGLSTFPSIQRRGYGLRNTGSLKKDLG